MVQAGQNNANAERFSSSGSSLIVSRPELGKDYVSEGLHQSVVYLMEDKKLLVSILKLKSVHLLPTLVSISHKYLHHGNVEYFVYHNMQDHMCRMQATLPASDGIWHTCSKSFAISREFAAAGSENVTEKEVVGGVSNVAK